MAGTTKSLGRKNKYDKFYTKSEVANYLISQIDINKYDFILEPSAGSGAFSNLIENCFAIDIEPENGSILKQDFFLFSKERGNILTIGNPPFGEQNNLAIKFFNHAAEFSQTIAFIFPKSFKKISIQNKLNLNYKLIKEIDLDENSFTLDGEDYNVPCIFQICEHSLERREKIIFPKASNYFSFTKDKNTADFRVQRVGGRAGQAFNDKNGAESSNYYLINSSNMPTKELVSILNRVQYASIEDTVGPKSLPKGEFIYYSNLAIEKEKNNG